MVELFRYIEQAFPAPQNEDDAIDISNNSDLQNTLRDLHASPDAGERMKQVAEDFLEGRFPASGEFPVQLASQYRSFYRQVKSGKDLNTKKAKGLVETIFDKSPRKLVQSEGFQGDQQLLNDVIAAFKLFSDFDRADAADLVAQRQAIALVEFLSSADDGDSAPLRKLLLRPVLVSESLLPPKKPRKDTPPVPPDNNPAETIKSLYQEIQNLERSRNSLATLPAQDIEFRDGATVRRAGNEPHPGTHAETISARYAVAPDLLSRITISERAFGNLHSDVRSALTKLNIQAAETDIPVAVNFIDKRIQELSAQIQPVLFPQPAKLYRVGVNLFAAQPLAFNKVTELQPLTELSAAVTKPLGIGNLQVVKQELIKYEPSEISHIENILEGEKYGRQTKRTESTEVTTIQEKESISFEERDLQSTERNEMVTESQNEISKQTTSTKEQTTTTDYGKLVENNKSNYARSVTDKAVTSLTQKVKEVRIQVEKKIYTEKTSHEFDNSKGNRKVRGIYQWVDKWYKTRILNYGKRLLYDVTIPEPAAFLLDTLKKAEQPESLNLVKPEKPAILTTSNAGGIIAIGGTGSLRYKALEPQDLTNSNYMSLVALYGVAGAVEPPPLPFATTMAWPSAGPGNMVFKSEKITIPPGYKAIKGYFQSTNWRDETGAIFQNNDGAEINIGEGYHFAMNVLSQSFKMNNETGDIPITFNAGGMKGHNVAVGIISQNDTALAKWQLKTFAAIMEGYRKQLAEYEDRLNKLQAAIRAQLMAAQNYAHNPSIEREELKKAFIFLILSEQYGKAFVPSPDPLKIPPDPKYNNKWGAMVSFFERAFEWENMMYVYYPYFWSQPARWGELILIQDINPKFEEFLKAGAARVVVPVRPGFEAPVAHFQETGEVWMGKAMPDMFSEQYVSIINEINERNFAPGEEKCMVEWDVKLPTTLVMLKEDEVLPEWKPVGNCVPDE
ncbi:hypothetical protein SAMN04488109_4955 [Chryseolinea serpens]|uniref:Uncharacterized protein n=1 Tax=Chryseolinea serpens TaxID=947013 RepID=A0A1M5VA56_9BACT|nr:hypothetical protein [Chryseolinea serpens]SHH72129.1 hypothetical protein SAMN04488109_4955 [Chryseolinea serpens]